MQTEPDEMFRSMVAVQITALVTFLIAGTAITVLVQPQVLGIVPEGGYGPLISWAVSGVVGYMLGGVIAAIVGAIGFFSLANHSRNHYQYNHSK